MLKLRNLLHLLLTTDAEDSATVMVGSIIILTLASDWNEVGFFVSRFVFNNTLPQCPRFFTTGLPWGVLAMDSSKSLAISETSTLNYIKIFISIK